MYLGFDPTYFLVLIGVVITLVASSSMKSTYTRYAKVAASSGLTGAQVAKMILQANDIYGVSVNSIKGDLTDHYDPSKKVLNLSMAIYSGTSLAALGVAAHECGHAIQDNIEYAPLKFRSALVPVVNIGSKLSWPLIIIGVLLGNGIQTASGGLGWTLVDIGIIAFSLAVLFQLVTLPVEFNASHRAMDQLVALNILTEGKETQGAQKVLKAAAMTYVAAAASSLLQLLRLILLFGGRRRND